MNKTDADSPNLALVGLENSKSNESILGTVLEFVKEHPGAATILGGVLTAAVSFGFYVFQCGYGSVFGIAPQEIAVQSITDLYFLVLFFGLGCVGLTTNYFPFRKIYHTNRLRYLFLIIPRYLTYSLLLTFAFLAAFAVIGFIAVNSGQSFSAAGNPDGDFNVGLSFAYLWLLVFVALYLFGIIIGVAAGYPRGKTKSTSDDASVSESSATTENNGEKKQHFQKARSRLNKITASFKDSCFIRRIKSLGARLKKVFHFFNNIDVDKSTLVVPRKNDSTTKAILSQQGSTVIALIFVFGLLVTLIYGLGFYVAQINKVYPTVITNREFNKPVVLPIESTSGNNATTAKDDTIYSVVVFGAKESVCVCRGYYDYEVDKNGLFVIDSRYKTWQKNEGLITVDQAYPNRIIK